MSIKFTILGCGSSMGVPRSDGYFGNCDPTNLKNYRSRCSGIIQTKSDNILIDTSPDLRSQLLAVDIKHIDAVFYTHGHADHLNGIDDLRSINRAMNEWIQVYTDASTWADITKRFSYVLEPLEHNTNFFYTRYILFY